MRCRGDLSLVANGFRCKQCDGTIQEADLAGDILVDRETHGCVKRFCYLGNTLDGVGVPVVSEVALLMEVRPGPC